MIIAIFVLVCAAFEISGKGGGTVGVGEATMSGYRSDENGAPPTTCAALFIDFKIILLFSNFIRFINCFFFCTDVTLAKDPTFIEEQLANEL